MIDRLRLERAVDAVPRHSLAILTAGLRSSVLIAIFLLGELLLIRADSAWLVGLGTILFVIHGAVAVSLFRYSLVIVSDIRRGLDGLDPQILTHKFFETAAAKPVRVSIPILALILFAYATPFYPAVKYLFRMLHTVHEEYYFGQLDWEAIKTGEGNHSAEVSQNWRNVARYRSAGVLSPSRSIESLAGVG